MSRKPRKTRQVIFVFCEGETELRYVDMLRTSLRVPIQIVPKVLGTKISRRLIDSHIKAGGYKETDKVFLFYDGDRKDIVEKLYSIPDVNLMISTPCVELWYLLHFTHHTAFADANGIKKILIKHYPPYEKGELPNDLRQTLLSNRTVAAERAKKLCGNGNPSTTAYLLPEYLDSIREA